MVSRSRNKFMPYEVGISRAFFSVVTADEAALQFAGNLCNINGLHWWVQPVGSVGGEGLIFFFVPKEVFL